MGAWILTRDRIRDHRKLRLFLEVNGKVRIDAPAADMVFHPGQIISAISRNVKLVPGDLVMMGCPGVGEPLRHKDVVRAGIEGIGVLENTVIRG